MTSLDRQRAPGQEENRQTARQRKDGQTERQRDDRLTDRDTKEEKKTKEQTNIKSDSSASDFVRLIWAYLISLQQTSIKLNGNHPNFLLFDEPAQHSMGVESMNAMLKILAGCSGLQSIVAASFDEAQETFKASTNGVSCNVIDLPRKIIEQL